MSRQHASGKVHARVLICFRFFYSDFLLLLPHPLQDFRTWGDLTEGPRRSSDYRTVGDAHIALLRIVLIAHLENLSISGILIGKNKSIL